MTDNWEFEKLAKALNQPEEVQLTSKGYEWTCPRCKMLNEIEEKLGRVQCMACMSIYNTCI